MSQKPISLLFVDDQIDGNFWRLAAPENCSFVHCKNYAEAKKLDQSFDLAVLDMALGDGCGLDLARSIRDKYPNTKLLAISGFFSAEEKKRLNELQFNGLLQKPFRIRQLREALSNCLQELRVAHETIQREKSTR